MPNHAVEGALGLGAIVSAIAGGWKFSEFAYKWKRFYEVSGQNASYVRLISRVSSDLREVERLLALPEVKDTLRENPQKTRWISEVVRSTGMILEEMDKLTGRVRGDVEGGGWIGIRHRVRWVLDENEKLAGRWRELETCHLSLVQLLGYLAPLEMLRSSEEEETRWRGQDGTTRWRGGSQWQGHDQWLGTEQEVAAGVRWKPQETHPSWDTQPATGSYRDQREFDTSEQRPQEIYERREFNMSERQPTDVYREQREFNVQSQQPEDVYFERRGQVSEQRPTEVYSERREYDVPGHGATNVYRERREYDTRYEEPREGYRREQYEEFVPDPRPMRLRTPWRTSRL